MLENLNPSELAALVCIVILAVGVFAGVIIYLREINRR